MFCHISKALSRSSIALVVTVLLLIAASAWATPTPGCYTCIYKVCERVAPGFGAVTCRVEVILVVRVSPTGEVFVRAIEVCSLGSACHFAY